MEGKVSNHGLVEVSGALRTLSELGSRTLQCKVDGEPTEEGGTGRLVHTC